MYQCPLWEHHQSSDHSSTQDKFYSSQYDVHKSIWTLCQVPQRIQQQRCDWPDHQWDRYRHENSFSLAFMPHYYHRTRYHQFPLILPGSVSSRHNLTKDAHHGRPCHSLAQEVAHRGRTNGRTGSRINPRPSNAVGKNVPGHCEWSRPTEVRSEGTNAGKCTIVGFTQATTKEKEQNYGYTRAIMLTTLYTRLVLRYPIIHKRSLLHVHFYLQKKNEAQWCAYHWTQESLN